LTVLWKDANLRAVPGSAGMRAARGRCLFCFILPSPAIARAQVACYSLLVPLRTTLTLQQAASHFRPGMAHHRRHVETGCAVLGQWIRRGGQAFGSSICRLSTPPGQRYYTFFSRLRARHCFPRAWFGHGACTPCARRRTLALARVIRWRRRLAADVLVGSDERTGAGCVTIHSATALSSLFSTDAWTDLRSSLNNWGGGR